MCLVQIVKSPPAIGKPEMIQGIRTSEAAARWGAKQGYSLVFFLPSKERVYADKTSKATASPAPCHTA